MMRRAGCAVRAVRVLLMLGSLAALPARAQIVTPVCTVLANPVAFGSYNPVSSTPLDSTGQVTVTCTAIASFSVSYTIAISPGASGSAGARAMTGTAGSLPYNLYTNSGRTTVWGDGSGGTSTVSDGYSVGLLQVTRNYAVYARIPARASAPAGAYSDTLTISVNY